MATEQYTVEAILKATDTNFSKVLEGALGTLKDVNKTLPKTTQKTNTFKDTTLGLMTAQAVGKVVSGAWNLITGSVDKAMGRIDTMDRFNATIELMTGSSDLAGKAISSINDAVKGTPYGLDVMSKSVQGFVTSAYDVEDAVRYMENWGNAVATYSDASNSSLSEVGFSLQKMAASGKVSLREVQSLTLKGIPVMQIYAQKAGMTTEEVSKSFSDGSISAAEFFEAMDEAFTTGTDGFPSLTNAAKDAGATWAGTFDNMKAAVTRGVQSIIEDIEKARAEAGKSTIKEAVADIGKSIEDVLKGLSPFITAIADNFELVAGAVGVLAGAWATSKIVDSVGNLATKWTTWIDKVSLSPGLLGDVTTALGSAGTAGVIAGVALLGIVIYEVVKELNYVDPAVKAARESLEGLSSEIDTMAANYVASTQQVDRYYKILQDLIAEEDKSEATKRRITEVVKTLNQLMPELNLSYDEQADKLNMTTEAIESQITSQKELMREQLKQNILNSVLKEEGDIIEAIIKKQIELGRVTDGRQRIEEARQKALNTGLSLTDIRYAELGRTANTYGTQQLDMTDEQIAAIEELRRVTDQETEDFKKHTDAKTYGWHTSTEAIEGMTSHMEKNAEATDQLNELYDDMPNYLDQVSESVDQITGDLFGLNEAQETSVGDGEGRTAAIEEQNARLAMSYREAYGEAEQALSDYVARTGEDHDEAIAKAAEYAEAFGMSTDDVVAAANAQQMSLEEWADLNKETLEELAAVSQEQLDAASSAVDDYTSATVSGFERLEQEASVSLDKYIETLKKNAEDTRNWTVNVTDLMEAGVSQGVIKELEKLGPAGATIAADWVGELEGLNGGTLGVFDELTPAAQAKLLELEAAFGVGMTASAEAAELAFAIRQWEETGKIPAEEIIAGAKAKFSDLFTAGENAAASYKDGVSAGIEEAEKAGGDLANVVPQAVKRNLEISSPSKVMQRLGENAGGSFERGLAASENKLNRTASRMGKTVENAVRQSLQIYSPSRIMGKLADYTVQGFVDPLEDSIGMIERLSESLAYAAVPDTTLVKSQVEMSFADTMTAATPMIFTLALGGREYRAFADDISREQGRTLRLQEVY